MRKALEEHHPAFPRGVSSHMSTLAWLRRSAVLTLCLKNKKRFLQKSNAKICKKN
jgi:hypothetical protein